MHNLQPGGYNAFEEIQMVRLPKRDERRPPPHVAGYGSSLAQIAT